MDLADIFLRELEKDANASKEVKFLGKKLAEKYRENLETCTSLAKQSCEWHYRILGDQRETAANRPPR